jgi:hypothetical protein
VDVPHAAVTNFVVDTKMSGCRDGFGFNFPRRHIVGAGRGNGFNHLNRLSLRFA